MTMKEEMEELRKTLHKKFTFFSDVLIMALQASIKDKLEIILETTEIILKLDNNNVSGGIEGLRDLYLMIWAYDKEMIKIAEYVVQGGKKDFTDFDIHKLGRESYNEKIRFENKDTSINDAKLKFEESRKRLLILTAELYNNYLRGFPDNVIKSLTSFMNDVKYLDIAGLDVERYKKIIDEMD